MHKSMLEKAAQFCKERRVKRIWRQVLSLMMAVVVFCTTYALILPAITLETSTAEPVAENYELAAVSGASLCCTPETLGLHTHSASCYDAAGSLICGCADFVLHTHGPLCYDADGQLICTFPVITGHRHTDECYTETEGHRHTESCCAAVTKLVCGLEESEGHTHTESCFETTEELICGLDECDALRVLSCGLSEFSEHTHSADCYDENGQLICGLPELCSHTHTAACFSTTAELYSTDGTENEDVYYCGLTEHTHSSACYDENGELTCELTEHTHSLACRSDSTADTETALIWEATLPSNLSGDWAADLLSVAASQLGYTESSRNYAVTEDGELKGYTRYGEWYGVPYGDWCAMFVSFALHYAKVPGMGFDSNCESWVGKLTALGRYTAVGSCTPGAGDLVFFDNRGSDGVADHIGIVSGVSEDGSFTTIEGNSGDSVAECSYSPTAANVLGFGLLPEPETLFDCGSRSHEHDEYCYVGEALLCGADTHTHTIECLIDSTNVEAVVAAIAALPTAAEVSETIAGFNTEWDAAAKAEYEEYYAGVLAQTETVYEQYLALHEDEQPCVTNYAALEELMEVLDVSKLVTDPEGFVNGVQYHSTRYPYYQISSHALEGDYDMTVFLLAPKDEYGESDAESTWEPYPNSEWTAKSDSNYILAYCSDGETYSSGVGADYKTYTIDNSRFTSEQQQKTLAGIIANTYPFITKEDMSARLAEAYDKGELTVDVSCCREAEFIIAAQWAIWSTNSLWEWWSDNIGDLGWTTDENGDPLYPDYCSEKCLNPLTKDEEGHEAGDADENGNDILLTHVVAIRDWLMQQGVPEELKVSAYDYALAENADGTFAISVTVELNRALRSDEYASYGLSIGNAGTALTALAAGETGFSVSLDGVAAEELGSAQVKLVVDGQHMQAYFFDSESYQDLIGGNWEYYTNDLSFEVGEKTAVSVTKLWRDADGNSIEPADIDSISVQLYADGVKYGSAVNLSGENGWYYEWTELLKYKLDGSEIEYTIRETPVSGYYSSVTTVEEGVTVSTVKRWLPAESLAAGKEYLIVSRSGALSYALHPQKSGYWVTWLPPELDSANPAANTAIWAAYDDPDSDGVLLKHKSTDRWMGSSFETTANESSAYAYYYDTNLYYLSGTTPRYINGHEAGGGIVSTADPELAEDILIYELADVAVPDSAVNYLLTNTAFAELTSVTVNKTWEGRRDDSYPESAFVTLVQNGRLYGDAVELNAENDWSFTWEGLPLSIDGVAVSYSVYETPIEFYEPTAELSGSGTEDSPYIIELTNTWSSPTMSLALSKRDMSTGQPLGGAVFELYRADDTAEERVLIPGTSDAFGVPVQSELATDGLGELVMNGVELGETYYLIETMAPAGYNLLSAPIVFVPEYDGSITLLTEYWASLEEDTLVVLNQPGFMLPETGGSGTIPYTAAGLVLCGISCLVYIFKKRRKEAEPS